MGIETAKETNVYIGLPTFFDQFFVSIIIMVYNVRLMAMIGPVGVSAYSIVSYLQPFVIMMLVGLSQSIQPIISANNG